MQMCTHRIAQAIICMRNLVRSIFHEFITYARGVSAILSWLLFVWGAPVDYEVVCSNLPSPVLQCQQNKNS